MKPLLTANPQQIKIIPGHKLVERNKNSQVKKVFNVKNIIVVSVFVGAMQIILGAPILATLMLVAGNFLCFLTVIYLQPLTSALGLLLAGFVMKTTGFFLIVKSVLLENWAVNATHPDQLAAIYFLGLIAVAVAARINKKSARKVTVPPVPARFYKILALYFFIAGIAIPYIVGSQNGGLYGALKIYNTTTIVAIPFAIYASLCRNPERRMWHPLAFFILVVSLLFAVINTGKEAFAIPLLGYGLTLVVMQRVSVLKAIPMLALGMTLLFGFIGPYSDWIRNTGVRELSGTERITAAFSGIIESVGSARRDDILANQSEFRSTRLGLLNTDTGYFGRLMSINEGYQLSDAVADQGSVSPSLFLLDLTTLVPRVFLPNKTEFGSNYFLSRFSGVVSHETDDNIGIAFGPIPSIYAMFDFFVFPFILFAIFYLVFWIVSRVEGLLPDRATIVPIFCLLWHSLSEGSNPISTIYPLIFLYVTISILKYVVYGKK